MPYLVDGNNLWGSYGGPRGLPSGRSAILSRVSSFCRAKGASAVLVFDGAPERENLDEQRFGAVRLRFPRPGEDADTLIRRIVDDAANAGDWIVVTSDKSLYSYCQTRGARVLQAHQWKALARPSAAAEGEAGEKPSAEDDIDGWLERFTKPR